MTASNGYSGTTTINGGTLQLGGGVLAKMVRSQTTSGVVNNSTLAYNLSGSQTVAYAISGNGNLEKAGTRTISSAVPSSFVGDTTVNSGTLQLNAANGAAGGWASPTITVNAGAFLALNNSDVIGYTAGREA